MQHPNIVTIHDVGTDGGLTYIAIELIDGESLLSVIELATGRRAFPGGNGRRSPALAHTMLSFIEK